MRTLTCPHCSVAMELFHAKARDNGPPVQLDRCPSCRRVWFDVPELERAVGRPYLSRMDGTPSPRACPACRAAMSDVLVGGEMTVEQCTQCKGALVDTDELKTLSGGPLVEHVPPLPPRRRADADELGDVISGLLHSLFG